MLRPTFFLFTLLACSMGLPSCKPSKPLVGQMGGANPKTPNVLLIILDDLGCDAFTSYGIGPEKPRMPRMESLANEGLRFTNFWAYPTCTPTRSSIITGKHAFETGMKKVGDELATEFTILQAHISEHATTKYAQAVIGKWHLGEDPNHPNQMGVPHYSGLLSGGVRDYSSWRKTTNGATQRSTEYITTALTNDALKWVGDQDQPWFLWLAYTAPHTPFHLPPSHLHSYDLPGTESDIEQRPQAYYFAMIEALDTEIGRLLDGMSEKDRANTVVLLMGDNGSPNQVVQTYGKRNAKGSIHEGGINVPLVAFGPGVSRSGEVEDALVNSTDLFATIAELVGAKNDVPSTSKSIVPLFSESDEHQAALYSMVESKRKAGTAVRDHRYKLLHYQNQPDELYDLQEDPYERNNLAGQSEFALIENRLRFLAASIEHAGETHTHGDQTHTHDPADHNHTFSVSNGITCTVDLNASNEVSMTVENGQRIIRSNGIPNHEVGQFPNAGNPHTISAQSIEFRMTSTPSKADAYTSVYSEPGFGIGRPQYVFGVVNNGVKLDPSAAEAFGPSRNERNFDWVKEALSSNNRLGDDCNNAHVQPNGEYHYHGTPWGVVEGADGSSMFHLGWAADGFPIYYKWVHENALDANSRLVEATTGYRLREGQRPGDGVTTPDGPYDGTYVRDFKYVEGSGTLDEAGGRFGVTPEFPLGTYYYVVTDAFPSVPRFFAGTPDPSFRVGGGPRPEGGPRGEGQGPPPGGREPSDRFKSMDKNRDGRIDREEAGPKLRNRFDRADRNGDGFITPDELGKE